MADGGLFDWAKIQQWLASPEAAGMAQGLLSASGPSATPVSLGAAFGMGMQGMQTAKDRELRERYYRGLVDKQDREGKSAKARDELGRVAAGNMITPTDPSQPGATSMAERMNVGAQPGIGMAAALQQRPDLALAAVGGDPLELAKAQQAFAKPANKWGDPLEVTGPDGKPLLIQRDEAGNIRPVDGFGPKAASPQVVGSAETGYFAIDPRTLKKTPLIGGMGRAPQTPIAVPDESSPTGFRYVDRAQALNQPAVGPTGMTVTTDKDGRQVISYGPMGKKPAGPDGMTQATQTEVQKQLLDASGNLAKITDIAGKFDPSFHQLPTQAKNWLTATKEWLNVNVEPAERARLNSYTEYLRSAGEAMAQVRHDLFGASLTKGEAGYSNQFLLDRSDSPTQAQAKINGFRDMTRKAVARLNYVQRNGMGIDAIGLDQMPDIMRRRGDILAGNYTAQGLEGDALKQAVRRQLASEFGLVGD